ncbi:MAG: hypothetical protein WBF01_14125 [Candidatus Acidiferrum sp.]
MASYLSASVGRPLLKVLFLGVSIVVAGCSNSQPENITHQTVLSSDVAPGVVLIDILEAGRPEHYWQYEVQPTGGLVREVKEERFQDFAHEDIPHTFQQPSGAIETCSRTPKANSPDGSYLAYCSKFSSDEFFVINRETTEALCHWKPTAWRGIKGFAWAPNSNSVAFLDESEYYGKSPLELLSGLSGHPVPHDTVYLDVLDVRTGAATEYMVRKNVISAFTRILEWSEVD